VISRNWPTNHIRDDQSRILSRKSANRFNEIKGPNGQDVNRNEKHNFRKYNNLKKRGQSFLELVSDLDQGADNWRRRPVSLVKIRCNFAHIDWGFANVVKNLDRMNRADTLNFRKLWLRVDGRSLRSSRNGGWILFAIRAFYAPMEVGK